MTGAGEETREEGGDGNKSHQSISIVGKLPSGSKTTRVPTWRTDSDLSEQETYKIPLGANKCENVKKTQDIIGSSLGKYCDIDGRDS